MNTPEQDDNVNDLLADIHDNIRDINAEKYRKRIRIGRAMILIIALLYLILTQQGIEVYEQGSYKLKVFFAIAVLYMALFIASLQKTYISLLLAVVTYIAINIYSLSIDIYTFRIAMHAPLFSNPQLMIIFTITVRMTIILCLMYSTVAAKKYEELVIKNDMFYPGPKG